MKGPSIVKRNCKNLKHTLISAWLDEAPLAAPLGYSGVLHCVTSPQEMNNKGGGDAQQNTQDHDAEGSPGSEIE